MTLYSRQCLSGGLATEQKGRRLWRKACHCLAWALRLCCVPEPAPRHLTGRKPHVPGSPGPARPLRPEDQCYLILKGRGKGEDDFNNSLVILFPRQNSSGGHCGCGYTGDSSRRCSCPLVTSQPRSMERSNSHSPPKHRPLALALQCCDGSCPPPSQNDNTQRPSGGLAEGPLRSRGQVALVSPEELLSCLLFSLS